MRLIVSLLFLCAAVFPAQAQQPPPAGTTNVETVRKELRENKRAVVEKYMALTPDEAKRFWPVYDEYQKKLDAIMVRQNRAVLDYINSEDSMTDANAKRIMKDVLEADADEQKLRERTSRTMLDKLPARKAARFMQIENKVRALNRFDLAERIPLVR